MINEGALVYETILSIVNDFDPSIDAEMSIVDEIEAVALNHLKTDLISKDERILLEHIVGQIHGRIGFHTRYNCMGVNDQLGACIICKLH